MLHSHTNDDKFRHQGSNKLPGNLHVFTLDTFEDFESAQGIETVRKPVANPMHLPRPSSRNSPKA